MLPVSMGHAVDEEHVWERKCRCRFEGRLVNTDNDSEDRHKFWDAETPTSTVKSDECFRSEKRR